MTIHCLDNFLPQIIFIYLFSTLVDIVLHSKVASYQFGYVVYTMKRVVIIVMYF